MSQYDEFPDTLEATTAWVAKNRPDVLGQFRALVDTPAVEFLVAMAFTAGKEHGEQRGDVVLNEDEREYFSDRALRRCGDQSGNGCGHLTMLHIYNGGAEPCVVCGCGS
jgi:hypothetical protein